MSSRISVLENLLQGLFSNRNVSLFSATALTTYANGLWTITSDTGVEGGILSGLLPVPDLTTFNLKNFNIKVSIMFMGTESEAAYAGGGSGENIDCIITGLCGEKGFSESFAAVGYCFDKPVDTGGTPRLLNAMGLKADTFHIETWVISLKQLLTIPDVLVLVIGLDKAATLSIGVACVSITLIKAR